MALKDKYVFVSLWEGSLHGIKGALINKETGKLRPIPAPGGGKQIIFFGDRDVLKKMGIKILRGKKRTTFLSRHGWKLDKETRSLKKKKGWK